MTFSRHLALVPLRDVVMFPAAECPIYVGRESTLKAIKYAKTNSKSEIAIFTQKSVEYSGPMTGQSLHATGTLCRMTAVVEMQDKSMKVMLEGAERIALENIEIRDGVTLATVNLKPHSLLQNTSLDETLRSTFRNLLSSWNSDYTNNLDHPEWINICQAKDAKELLNSLRTLFLCPRLSSANDFKKYEKISSQQLNDAVFLRQKVLDENDESMHWSLIKEALLFDISCRTFPVKKGP